MPKLSLFYPVSPFHLNQGFGENAAYYARFHDQMGNPEKGHNGNDLMAYHGQPVYAATDGMAQFARDEHGGEGIYITTVDKYEYKGSQVSFRLINWHLIGDTDRNFPSPIPLTGSEYPVKAGDLIGYADNTGAPFESSGDHLHLGLIPLNSSGSALEPGNGFNGCVDAYPYFNGNFAKDANKVNANLAVQVGLLQKIVQLLTSILKNRG